MVMAIFSFSDGKPVLLGNYKHRHIGWIDEDGFLHENGSSGADYSSNAVYKIADGGDKLELIAEFGTDGVEWIGDAAYTVYYKVVDGEKVSITESESHDLDAQYGKYLGSHEGAAATKEDSGLTFTPLYTEEEIAMEMYEAVLDGKVKIYNTNNDEYVYLKDYKATDVGISLCETKDLGYVYMDVNNDSVNELFIHHGEISVLWYHKGMICVDSPMIANDDLNRDGSFSWRTYTADFGYGESKIIFEGTELKTEVLWRIVNDGEPNAEYYIGSEPVTQEEILKYFEDNPKTKAEFIPLEASWQNKVSHAQAIVLAREYWERFDIEENGYIVVTGNNAQAPSSVYVVLMKWYVLDHYSTLDEIWIDKNTGEAIVPYAIG